MQARINILLEDVINTLFTFIGIVKVVYVNICYAII